MEVIELIIKQFKIPVVFTILLGFMLPTGSFSPLPAWSDDALNSEKVLSSQLAAEPKASQNTIPRMSVRRTAETDDASLYIELNEVVKIRSRVGEWTPQERAKAVQDRLSRFLEEGGSPRDIKPGQEGNQVVVRAGEAVLLTVDAGTAQKAQHTPKALALQWTNRIRTSLGVEPLTRDTNQVASRGFSPSVYQLREAGAALSVSRGMASWYGPGFHGRRSANGERFNMHALTAAHRTLPFNTRVRVTNNRTGQSAVVRITDRGPFYGGRIIDLSKGAAQAVGMLSSGTAPVTVEVLGR